MVRLEGKLCVFPGIPRLFQKMLDGLLPFLPLPPASERPFRQQVFTTYETLFFCPCWLYSQFLTHRQPESSIAPYLTELHNRLKGDGIRVGSYPLLSRGVYVALIGRDVEAVKALAEEVAKALDGRLVSDEEAREMVKQKESGAA